MKISTKGRYALKLMLDLAVYNTGEPISIRDISRRQNISDKYLEQIIAILNKSGFVKSVRGAQGGYMLKYPASYYTVGMILRQTEGDLWPVSGIDTDATGYDYTEQCVTVRVWEKLYDAINGVVDGITLADLVEWQTQKADYYVI